MISTNGIWYFSSDHKQLCQVIETQTLWGENVCRVWLPESDSVVRIPAARLSSLENINSSSPERIAYIAAAGRVADLLTQDLLLAPIGSTVIPLPHQIRALSRAISGDRVRYLLADEVGLGKTIEAGLILRELKLRGLVRRILVVAPKGLVNQWVSEMSCHFGESFQLVLPEDIKTLKRMALEDGDGNRLANAWQKYSQIVVSMDSVKPLDKRRGWSPVQLAEYNQERFEDLISAGWDLIIVDEAHRLGGSSDQVARFKLGQGLAEAAPYFLLLSATPHQGKTEAFHRLVSLLDPLQFADVESITRERLQPYLIRTEKRRAIDAEGKPLFKFRRTQLGPVSWEIRHRDQQRLYEAVTSYVREGYNQALKEKKNYIGFLLILLQRLVVSSTSAIRATLERRMEALIMPEEQLSLFPTVAEEEWAELDGQEQVEVILGTRLKSLKNERAEVKLLLEAAARCEQTGPDAKAEALLDWIYRLQSEEGDTNLKILVFTEFVPTQKMLQLFLQERGFAVVCLNGSLDMDNRRKVQADFATDARILISTDAGGEGLNLQFCHVVINYDIPWNPMRLEQRIGRVDRIGQNFTVRAVNLILNDSVEHRVREVLEEKLAVIFEEFGIDKTGDVLDSALAGPLFDEMYMEAILHPDHIENSVGGAVRHLQDQIREERNAASVLGESEELQPEEAQRLLAHPLPHWVERMTVNYLNTHGGKAEKHTVGWNLTWPDGARHEQVVFSAKEVDRFPRTRHLTIEDPRIRGLTMQMPRFVSGQLIPVVSIPKLSPEIVGMWSLWKIEIVALDWSRRQIVPIFQADNGAFYMPTARYLWDLLLENDFQVVSTLSFEHSQKVFEEVQAIAEERGQSQYITLVQAYQAHIARERERAEYAFSARRRILDRIGLPQVRKHRLQLLAREEQAFQEQLEKRMNTYPELTPLLMIRVEGRNE